MNKENKNVLDIHSGVFEEDEICDKCHQKIDLFQAVLVDNKICCIRCVKYSDGFDSVLRPNAENLIKFGN